MVSKKTNCPSYSLNTYNIIRNREMGMRPRLGSVDDLARKVYSNTDACQGTMPLQSYSTNQGGIFNLEFSLDGQLLVAVCEERSVLLFDAANQKQLRKVSDAHSSCVNCVRFLDTHTFATCSDDNTVKLWDTRRLVTSLRTLQGHASWVKNIEYIEKDKTMVTSAFDGSIYAWDLNSPTENNVLYNNVLVMNGLMRTKLTPDGSKMIICTTTGYIIIIHDLNLETLENDLKSFRPQLYRLMQLSDQSFPTATAFNYLFSQNRKSNRLEFIDDFPNDAEVISSLQIHPMGWCALSRNINNDEKEEWTTVHDIQTRDPKDYAEAYRFVDEPAIDENVRYDFMNRRRPTDIWMGFVTNEHLSAYRSRRIPNTPENIHSSMGIINSGLIGENPYARHFRNNPEEKHRVILNVPRLTHFIKEQSAGKGYIKELCFSSDGRIICSPYDKGVRLLGFNEHMQELCYCVPNEPRELFVISEMNDYHPDCVVSCKFNPRHYQMVSGCLKGDIVWYKPYL